MSNNKTFDGPTIKVSKLKPHSRNPRKISNDAMEKLVESIDRNPEFMRLRPMIVDNDNIVLGGNQRLRAIKELGLKDIPVEWVVKASELTVEQKREFMIIDNSPEGMSGIWDIEILADDWDKFHLEELGVDVSFFKDEKEIEAPVVTGEFPTPPPVVLEVPKRGDLYILGDHRLLCGDPANEEDVQKVMLGEDADYRFGEASMMAFTDYLPVEEGEDSPKEKPNVAFYSAGKDSTAMLILMKKQGVRIDEILYVDCGTWADPVGDHNERVEKYMGMKITTLPIGDQLDKKLDEHGFPSVFIRWCTTLKMKAKDDYVKEKYGSTRNIRQFIGLAYSEKERVFQSEIMSKHHMVFPLVEHRVSENDAFKMCYDEGFDFGGHYSKGRARMGCWCCPLQSDQAVFNMMQFQPEQFEKLKEMQNRSTTRAFKIVNKTPWWYEHTYWARYTCTGVDREMNVGTCKDVSDPSVLPSTIKHIRENTLKGQTVLVSEGFIDDVIVACQQIGRKCRAIETVPQNVVAILERFRKDTGIDPVKESEVEE